MSVYPKERFISLLMRKEIPKNRKRAEAERFVPFFLQFYPFFCALYPERAREMKKCSVFLQFLPDYLQFMPRRDKKGLFTKRACVGGVYSGHCKISDKNLF